MKKTIIFLSCLIFTTILLSQSPQSFKYQAIIRDDVGNVIPNQSIGVRISIIKGDANGSLEYQETHLPATNQFGLINLNIGQGNNTIGNFSEIEWGNNNYFVRIGIDINGGSNYSVMGTSQLLSVPYSLYSNVADSSTPQTLSVNNHELSISGGNTVPLPDTVNDADHDPLNEIQTLSVIGDSISISSGNTVQLPPPSGAAGGDLSGTYPNPVVAGIQNNPVSSQSPNSGEVLKWEGTLWEPDSDGMALPYSDTCNTSTNAFEIVQEGTGKTARFEILNSSSNATVLYVKTNSTEDAVYINNDGSGRALRIRHEANNDNAVDVIHYGDAGNAGYFKCNSNNTDAAIYAFHAGNGYGIYGKSSSNGYAGYFITTNSNNTNPAMYVESNSDYAAKFEGDVEIVGNISKSSGTFKIDHPLDPENKYLYHSFVESNDMMNIYNGIVTLDESGIAWIELESWFVALNKDYRYQLTCIGGWAPVYISKEIENNKFKIAGGKSNMKISWQVTGIRKDPYANEHRIKTEIDKNPKEKGYYLHYNEYGQSYEKSIEFLNKQKE